MEKNIFKKSKRIILDISICLIIIGSIVADLCINNPLPKRSIPSDIILILLPTIITIISISLSLIKDSLILVGIKMTSFNKLRSSCTYSFLEMIVIVITIFVLYSVFAFFNLQISIISLELVSAFYALYFTFQEVPILLQKDKIVQKIIKRAFLKYIDDKKKNAYNSRDIIVTEAVQYLIFSIGIKRTYLFFSDKSGNNSAILDNILTIENSYLHELELNKEFFKSSPNMDYKMINIGKTIELGYDNICDLMSFSEDFNYLDILNNENISKHLSSNIYALHNISKSLSLADVENNSMSKIIDQLISNTLNTNKIKEKNNSYILLNYMIVMTLKEKEEFWFVEYIRDSDSFESLFYSKTFQMGLFHIIYFFYLSKNSMTTSDSTRQAIDEFVKSRSKSFNTQSSWIQMAVHCIEENSNMLELINELLSFYNLFIKANSLLFTYLTRGVFSSKEDFEFNENHLIDAWLEIILFSPRFFEEEKDMLSILNSLGDSKKVFVDRFSKKWMNSEKNGINNNIKPELLDYLGITRFNTLEDRNVRCRIIIHFCESFNKSEKLKQIENNIKNARQLLAYKEKLRDGFYDSLYENILVDKALKLDDSDVQFSISELFDSEYVDILIEHYVKSFKSLFSKIIENYFNKKVDASLYSEEYNLSDEVKRRIIDFNPDYMTERSEMMSAHGNIEPCRNTFLPTNVFWKKNGIKINFYYDDKSSTFRKLTKNEIDKMIDRDYKVVNGMYKYNSAINDDTKSFWVNRKELQDLLSKSILLSIITFKYKVMIDAKKVFFVKNKED